MDSTDAGVWVAEIMNVGWSIRNLRKNEAGQLRRTQALARMGVAVGLALASNVAPEPVLYAVAASLYDRHDPRFQI